MYIDPITRQTFEYANQIPCENNRQNVISLDPETDQKYVSTRQPPKRHPPVHFEPTRVQTAISPNTFTAKDAGNFSQKKLKLSWNRVLFTKQSDKTFQLLGKTISYETMRKQFSELLPNNPYKTLRLGLHDYLLNVTPFFPPERFTDAFIKHVGYPCYILFQCRIYFFHCSFSSICFQHTP